jgi:hypothetical protein
MLLCDCTSVIDFRRPLTQDAILSGLHDNYSILEQLSSWTTSRRPIYISIPCALCTATRMDYNGSIRLGVYSPFLHSQLRDLCG